MPHATIARIGPALRRLRKERTLRKVAEETGYDFTWFSKVENGREVPSWDALKEILACYGETDLAPWAYALLMETRKEQFKLALTAAK